MIQEVQRTVVGPVQVFDLQHDGVAAVRRGLGGDTPEHLGRGVECAIADLPGILADAPDMRALAKVDPDQMAQQMGLRLRHVGAIAGCQQWCDAGFDLVSGRVDVVTFADMQATGHDVAQEAIGLIWRQRIGAAMEHAGRLGLEIDPVFEFAE